MRKTILVIFTSLLISIQSICFGFTIADTLEDAYVESQNTKQKIIVVFGADWCKFCKQLSKDLNKQQENLQGYIYVYVNIDERPDLKIAYSIKTIPDTIILENNIETKRKIGYKGMKDFLLWITQ